MSEPARNEDLADSRHTRTAKRESWTSKSGFLLAAIGSAIGLGNMWRFPYFVSEYGGAAFVVLYVAITFSIGIPLIIVELQLGTRARLSPVGALRSIAGARWPLFGYLFALTGVLIIAYYAVIAGWVVRLLLEAIVKGLPGDAAAHFSATATGPTAIVYALGFVGLATLVLVLGVKTGIERSNKIMMPLLAVLLIGLLVWVITLPGAGRGYSYYLRPNAEKLLSLKTLSAAAGQAIFSLSLGMGALLTYASYASHTVDLRSESTWIALADSGSAFLAGLVVFPLLFALGMQSSISESSVGVLFISIPGGLAKLGVLGRIIAIPFFLMLLLAALASTISVIEVVVATLIDELGMQRRSAVLLTSAVIAALGIPPGLDLGILGLMDQLAGNVLLIIGAIALALVAAWRMKDPAHGVLASSIEPRYWVLLVGVVAPAFLILVLVGALRTAWEALAALAP